MKTDNRVAWTEGMFLRVQHFQQADRWTERLIRDRTEALTPYPWGVVSYKLDQSALGVGRVALTEVRGILPDGTPFSAPDMCDLPPPLQLAEGSDTQNIYLALPMSQTGQSDFVGDAEISTIRYQREDYEAADSNSETSFTAPVSIGRFALSLKREHDERAGYECLPLARVVETRADLSVVLDEEMIPPVLIFGASKRLRGYMTEILGLLRHRANAIASRMGDPSLRGAAEVSDYLMLQALNRAIPEIDHLDGQAGQIHPETAYRTLVALAGELATFTASDHLAPEFSSYVHMDPAATFGPVMDELRRSLSMVLDQSAVLIPLEERRHGVRVGMITDAALKSQASMVFAVRADIPQEQLRRQLPNQIKIGPVEKISELVNVALPGIRVRPLPVAPRQLPFQSATVYFELDTEGELWRAATSSGALAIHLSSEFPGLEMELWGIRA